MKINLVILLALVWGTSLKAEVGCDLMITSPLAYMDLNTLVHEPSTNIDGNDTLKICFQGQGTIHFGNSEIVPYGGDHLNLFGGYYGIENYELIGLGSSPTEIIDNRTNDEGSGGCSLQKAIVISNAKLTIKNLNIVTTGKCIAPLELSYASSADIEDVELHALGRSVGALRTGGAFPTSSSVRNIKIKNSSFFAPDLGTSLIQYPALYLSFQNSSSSPYEDTISVSLENIQTDGMRLYRSQTTQIMDLNSSRDIILSASNVSRMENVKASKLYVGWADVKMMKNIEVNPLMPYQSSIDFHRGVTLHTVNVGVIENLVVRPLDASIPETYPMKEGLVLLGGSDVRLLKRSAILSSSTHETVVGLKLLEGSSIKKVERLKIEAEQCIEGAEFISSLSGLSCQ
jgi:hypothetical protein